MSKVCVVRFREDGIVSVFSIDTSVVVNIINQGHSSQSHARHVNAYLTAACRCIGICTYK